MAAITGTTGNITGGSNVILNPFSWSANWSRDVLEATAFQAVTYAAKRVGLHKLTGSAEGFIHETTAANIAGATGFSTDSLTFVLTASTTHTYTFQGVFTSWAVTSGTGELSKWSATFESSGAVTPS